MFLIKRNICLEEDYVLFRLNPLNQVYVFNTGIKEYKWRIKKMSFNPLNQVYVFNSYGIPNI